MDLREFKKKYPLQSPQKHCECHELIRLGCEDGLRLLGAAPADCVLFGIPRTSRCESGENCYLWVVSEHGIPYIIELRISNLGDKKPKHTNLTGGEKAYIGGEIWFENASKFYLSGSSGRYPAYSETQWYDVILMFETLGYEVVPFKWDPETGPDRYYDGS